MNKIISNFFLSLFIVSPLFADETLWLEPNKDVTSPAIELPSFAPVIEKLGKSVVNISIEGKENPIQALSRNRRFGLPNQEEMSPFDFYFQIPPELQGQRSFQSLGSGFVIHPDGYLVTNNHVVDKATKIIVTFRDDDTPYTAQAIGVDKKTDLALLKLDAPPKDLTAVTFGDSDKLKTGDWVLAIGNPFRLGHTATAGIVSAKSRKLAITGPYDDFIQTDASINPGNSGGPLFNSHGEVVGVNTAIFSPGGAFANSGFNVGIGFAIPINIVKDIVNQLHKTGKVVRGFLGVLVQPINADNAEALKLDNVKGALVAEVVENSPAKKAGIQRGDVIVKFNGHDIDQNNELPVIVAKTKVGETISLDVIRNAKRITLKTKVEELKDEAKSTDIANPEAEKNSLGLGVQNLTPEIARSLGLKITEGVIITAVQPESEGDKKGLKTGDIILEADSTPVRTTRDFASILSALPKNKPLLLLVQRSGSTIFITLRP